MGEVRSRIPNMKLHQKMSSKMLTFLMLTYSLVGSVPVTTMVTWTTENIQTNTATITTETYTTNTYTTTKHTTIVIMAMNPCTMDTRFKNTNYKQRKTTIIVIKEAKYTTYINIKEIPNILYLCMYK